MSDAKQTIFVSRNADDPFARVPKKILDDVRLSWKAKGVLAYLLGKPTGWKVRVGDISKRGKDGESAIRSALDELRHVGFASLERLRDGEGKTLEWFWKIADEPIYGKKTSKNPESENPEVENPDLENRDISKKEESKNEVSKSLGDPRRGVNVSTAPDAVERIYDLYPRKVGKPAALKAIEKAIKSSSFESVLQAAEKLAEIWRGYRPDDMRFVPHPSTFFNASRHLDDPTTWPKPKEDAVRKEAHEAGWDREAFKSEKRKEAVNV